MTSRQIVREFCDVFQFVLDIPYFFLSFSHEVTKTMIFIYPNWSSANEYFGNWYLTWAKKRKEKP